MKTSKAHAVFVLGVTYRNVRSGAKGRCVRTSDKGTRATLRDEEIGVEFSASKRENYEVVKA